MFDLFKKSIELSIKTRWLKKIDKECDEYIKLKRCLKIQNKIVNDLIKKYEDIYGENLREYHTEINEVE